MYQNESLGKGSRVAFEELIRLSHLNVSCVANSLCKPQFHTFLTGPLMIADNVQRLPGSEASNNGVASAEAGSADPGRALLSGLSSAKQCIRYS